MEYRGMQMPPGFPPPRMQGGNMMGDGRKEFSEAEMMGMNMMNQPPPGAMMNPQMMPDHFNPNQMEGYFPGPAQGMSDYHDIHSVLVDGGDRFGVSACMFDKQDLLWMGNSGGHVTGYYGLELQKYTSFQVHMSEDIRQMIPIERGILSLTRSTLNCSLRRGLSMFNYKAPSMQEMQCMIMTSPTSVLLGGHQTAVIELDIEGMREIRQVDVPEPGCAIFRSSNKYICAGDTSGKVRLYDPATLRPEHVLDAHNGTLSDFDLQGNLLVTCGFSARQNTMTVDRFLMVYDMRVMRAMAPIQVVIDPMFLRFIHIYNNKLMVVSQAGQFQTIDTNSLAPTPLSMQPVNTHGNYITSFDISETCQVLAFGDSGGYLHEFASGDHPVLNTFSQAPEFADPTEAMQFMHINDEITPYSVVPMVYPPNGKLLSDWPDQLTQNVYRKPMPVDNEILRSMKMQHNVGYAKLPQGSGVGVNQIPYKIGDDKKGSKKGKPVPESPIGRGDDPFVVVPKRYQKVDLKYSKLGLEDFDFRHYNKTHFAGLETGIPNAYCNCMLQILYYIEPLRVALLNHLCRKEFCLSCELGFLFHMLDSQKGQTCQATNFLRAFRTIPEASALGLVLSENEENESRINLLRLIQSWSRFIFHQVHTEAGIKVLVEDSKKVDEAAGDDQDDQKTERDDKASAADSTPPKSKKKKKKKGKKKGKEPSDDDKSDGKKDDDDEKDKESTSPDQSINLEEERFEERSIISDLFGMRTNTTLKCRCGQEMEKVSDTTIVNLHYPDCSPPAHNKPPVRFTFAEVVKHSLSLEQNTQAWCNSCERYQPHMQSKVIKNIPDILALNCGMENIRDLEFWKIQQMLIKQKREEEGSSQSFSVMTAQMPVMCRYGRACTRKGCRFRHESDMMNERPDMPAINPDEDPDLVWIPYGLKVILGTDGKVDIEELPEDAVKPKFEDPFVKYYDLYATVGHIKDQKNGNTVISQIFVGETYHQRKEGVTCTQWYLMNDFSITPIEKHEATNFNMDWKVPCSVFFIKKNIVKSYDIQVKIPISEETLLEDNCLVSPERRKISFTSLTEEEAPKPKDIVGLDAEFVSLNQEESELRSDGTRSTIKPSHLTAARITCLRGQGDQSGEPFIDDYISTQEQVVDYLTQYSGIKPGDLDPTISSRYLTTLKSTYLKLRYLVQSGVMFIGHGLKKDFRVINLFVPKTQVVDTVELFHLPRQRMISLKFLAWYFLKINIQSATHDSVEDARTAIQLHRKYQEFAKEGSDHVRAKIKEMYDYGRKIQWKIPDIEEEDADNQVAML